MESKKINLKKILNSLIISFSILLAGILIGISFIKPVASVKALDKNAITDTYNISFVSAKTKVRQATGYGNQIFNTGISEYPSLANDDRVFENLEKYVYEYSDKNSFNKSVAIGFTNDENKFEWTIDDNHLAYYILVANVLKAEITVNRDTSTPPSITGITAQPNDKGIELRSNKIECPINKFVANETELNKVSVIALCSNHDTTKLYYSNDANALYGDNMSLTANNSDIRAYQEFYNIASSNDLLLNGYIPHNISAYQDVNGNMVDVFYDEFDNNDVVLLNNNDSAMYEKGGAYNVENLYLSFGAPYIAGFEGDDFYGSQMLNKLSVSAKFYPANEKNKNPHILKINKPSVGTADMDKDEGTANNEYYFWHQYLDLKNLTGVVVLDADQYEDSESNFEYQINTTEGKYEFTFQFLRYNENYSGTETVDANGNNIGTSLETYTYTFYVYDSNTYSEFPTISNADHNINKLNAVDEYYYNFQTDLPTLTYDPSKFNLSYTREYVNTVEKVSSTFDIVEYAYDAYNNFPVGRITYTDPINNTNLKTVYIVTWHNNDKTQVEYLYLYKLGNPKQFNDFESLIALIESGELIFDYKVIEIFNTSPNKKIQTIRHEDYKYLGFYTVFEDDLTTENDTVLPADPETKVQKYTTSTYTLASGTQTKHDKINEVNQTSLNIHYLYDLVLEDLGLYTFEYKYIVTYYDADMTATHRLVCDTTLGTNSTHALSPIDYTKYNSTRLSNYNSLNSLSYVEDEDKSYDNLDLIITYSAPIQNNKATILGTEFTISGSPATASISGTSGGMKALEDYGITLTTSANTDAKILTVSINLGKIDYTNSIASKTEGHSSKHDFVKDEFEYTINLNLSTDNTPELHGLRSLLNALSSKVTFVAEDYTSSIENQDKLHIFGSVAKFNRNTDNGKATFKQVDKKENLEFYSDFTSILKNSVPTTAIGKGATLKSPSGISEVKDAIAKHLIVTDRTPIQFMNNCDEYVYNEASTIVYRYNFSLDTAGNITVDNSSVTQYDLTPTSYIQLDGYYEVIITYNYNSYYDYDQGVTKSPFVQMFAFVINNTTPKFTLEKELLDKDGNPILDASGNPQYTSFGSSIYTNRSVRIMWDIPTYFQHDVFFEINKTYYTANTEQYTWFNALYRNKEVEIINEGTLGLTEGVTSYIANKNTNKYIITINYNDGEHEFKTHANGKYDVSIRYSSDGKSRRTETFYIDNQPISNIGAWKYGDNQDSTSLILSLPYNSQLINDSFTLAYDAKLSGAKITTYWSKIQLTRSSDATELIKIGEKTASTTDYKIYADDNAIAIETEYVYNPIGTVPTFDKNGQINKMAEVNTNNIFNSNASAIYMFRMVDEAGNTAEYVVFVDKTVPKYFINPEPDNINNIVNKTTGVLWTNYKSIEIIPATADTDEQSKTKYNKAINYINNFKNSTEFKGLEFTTERALLPVDRVEVNDDKTKETTKYTPNDTSGYYLFTKDPVTTDQSGDKWIDLPTTNSSGDEIIKTYKIVGIPQYTSTIDIQGQNLTNRYIKFTYFDGDLNKSVNTYGVIGAGLQNFKVFDNGGNFSSVTIWMNLDKTQTYAYATTTFTNEPLTNLVSEQYKKDATKPLMADNVTTLSALLGDTAKSYAVSQLFISSLISEDDTIPEYELTYKYHPYNADLYEDYKITSISTEKKDNNIYLLVTFTSKSNTSITKTVQLADSENQLYPTATYPYEMEGTAIIADAKGNPKHVYDGNFLNSYSEGGNPTGVTRVFSTTINETRTLVNSLSVPITKEGIYIFKREYINIAGTEAEIQQILGEDKKIVYYVYYVDRSGIINISTSTSTADTLYKIGKDINFVLGDNYNGTNANYKHNILAEEIQSKQTSSGNQSNTNNNATDIFNTNKVQTAFNLTYDKFNFVDFVASNEISVNDAANYLNSLNGNYTTDTILGYTLLNLNMYSKNLYKLDLKLEKGSSQFETIIDETNDNSNLRFNEGYIDRYIAGGVAHSNYVRNNNFNFFFGGKYNIYLTDQSGILNTNYNSIANKYSLSPNTLSITFNINHTAPHGEFYGKYYEEKDYDYDNEGTTSIPFVDNNGEFVSDVSNRTDLSYALISKYWKEGNLKPNTEHSIHEDSNGTNVRIFSTNNETLVFMFTINPNDNGQRAKIDKDNLTIYKDNNVIFSRVDGQFKDAGSISKERMASSFIYNKIDGIEYYAIIIFDNNLDDILDGKEKELYGDFRLLDKENNNDLATYYVDIKYVGNNKTDYISDGNINYFTTRYEITVDRIKPTYNLAKLMYADKYIYNPIANDENAETLTEDNYTRLFNEYKQYYNFTTWQEYDFERSDIENYFFAVSSKFDTVNNKDLSFKFESINNGLDNDSSNFIYFKQIADPENYKFALTPDDYKVYHNANALENEQFTPNTAIPIDADFRGTPSPETYYKVGYYLFSTPEYMSIHDLVSKGIMAEGNYYEIIECDEAENYRVYAIFIPNIEDTNKNYVTYKYKPNDTSLEITETLNATKYPYAYPAGLTFEIGSTDPAIPGYRTDDRYLKAYIDVMDKNVSKYKLTLVYDPYHTILEIRDRNNNPLTLPIKGNDGQFLDCSINVDVNYSQQLFSDYINAIIKYFETEMRDVNSQFYTQYGYNIKLSIVNRTGIYSMGEFNNYEFDYSVAGSFLEPKFYDSKDNNMFRMQVLESIGSTYITKVRAYKFNTTWQMIDIDMNGKSFYKSANDLKDGEDFYLGRGVYMFVLTDNFNRNKTEYHEIGVASTPSGGVLNFTSTAKTHSDGYTYTYNNVSFAYDSSVYNIIIKFNYGTDTIIYESDKKNNYIDTLNNYGIDPNNIITNGNITTILFTGISDSELSKYKIEITHSNKNIGEDFKYEKKFAIYTAVQEVAVRNMNGSILDTTTHLNLTEDFELLLAWNPTTENRINFNSTIILTRKYQENGKFHTVTYSVANGYVVTLPGEYTAYVLNDLGARSSSITFTRGEGNISMYALYAIDNSNIYNETLLSPSMNVTKTDGTIITFNYFITKDYFSYIDTSITEGDNKVNPEIEVADIASVKIDKTAIKYIDLRVNSNLNILSSIHSIAMEEGVPCVTYRIYTRSITADPDDDGYTYRYVKIKFLDIDGDNTKLADILVNGTETELNSIKTTDKSVNLTISFVNKDEVDPEGIPTSLIPPVGDTITIEKYYNGNIVETTILDMKDPSNPANAYKSYDLKIVGLYEFVIKDLAGRTHKFTNYDGTKTNKLQISVVNEIPYEVNGSTPLNNQIFNDTVEIKILDTLSDISRDTIGIKATKNNKELENLNASNLRFTEPGYYSITMTATTTITDGNTVYTREVSSTYNFVIIKTYIAQSNFSVSKGKGLLLDKLIKKTGDETYDLTDEYLAYAKANPSTNTLLLNHKSSNENIKVYGNAVYTVTMKAYNRVTEQYEPFTFSVWINNEKPTLIPNVSAGTTTTENITIDYNPGLIYSQIGKCYIYLDDNSIVEIDENSELAINTITISTKGEHWIKIISENGSLISSYKFTKKDPLNSTAKIAIGAGIGGVIFLVGLFFFIRRKGKYR